MRLQRALFGASLLSCTVVFPAPAQTAPAYPSTRRVSQVDDYHGSSIADPYRWLEDTDSPETKAWVQEQNKVTFGYLSTIPERTAIRNRLTQVWNYPKYGVPEKFDDRLFFTENSGLLNQAPYYVKDGDRPQRILIDPNTLSSDGTASLGSTAPSPNGKLLAYSISFAGSDWREVRVRNVDTGRDAVDTLKWVKFSGIAWTRDNKGFFYQGYDPQTSGNTLTNVNRNQRVYYHRLGTKQSADLIIYDNKDQPNWLFGTKVSDDGRFAIINAYQGSTRSRLYYIYLDNPKRPSITAPVVRLIDNFESANTFIHNSGDFLLVRTDLGAPKGRVVQIDINNSEPRRWVSVIPEGKDPLVSAHVAGKRLVLEYLQDAHSSLRIYGMPDLNAPRPNRSRAAGPPGTTMPDPAGRTPAASDDRRRLSAPGYPFIVEVQLPGLGSVGEISGSSSDNEMFYSFTSFVSPPTIYRYDLKRGTNAVYKASTLPIDASQFETKQVFFKSKDGTRVPMFVTMKKGTVLNGNNPTILYGYGGFNVAETPSFSPANLVWMEMGGIYAVANIRGGSEYGKEWHEAGILGKKQNVFDDFIAAAEYLIREKYTSTPKLAISGASNGGLLVGAVMNQRPELFGAALPAVGVMDMLRYQKFTIGWAWTSDYGSSDDPKHFEFLRAYSPLHNIKTGTRYPATLVTTADHDDRVVPGHSFKYAAALQAAQAGPAPVLIRIETRAGHGAGKPTTKRIEEAADKFAFLARNLGMRVQLQ